MWLAFAQWGSLTAAVVLTYVWAIRPELKKLPALASFYAVEGSWAEAVRLKLAGIKGLLTTRISMVLAGYIAVHDFIASNAGAVDWMPLTEKVPHWVWPFLLFADFLIIMKFREFTDRRNAAEKEVTK